MILLMILLMLMLMLMMLIMERGVVGGWFRCERMARGLVHVVASLTCSTRARRAWACGS